MSKTPQNFSVEFLTGSRGSRDYDLMTETLLVKPV